MGCKCGGVILADTEDWAEPLCYECYDQLPLVMRYKAEWDMYKYAHNGFEDYLCKELEHEREKNVHEYKMCCLVNTKKYNELLEENEKLKKALEHYADVDSWYDQYGEMAKNGSVAIQALKEINND